MKIAIHQPNFLPWMGYFYKISQCDIFAFYDEVEYTKRSFIRRVKIHKPHDFLNESYIIVPLKKHSDYAEITALKLLDDPDWQRKIRAQLHHAYQKAPFYFQIRPILDAFFTQPPTTNSFSEFTTEIIKYISEMLDLAPQWSYASDLEIGAQKANANIEIIQKLSGKEYISGNGAKKYQKDESYTESGIQISYSDFQSKFAASGIPQHFYNKSIISYLACYEVSFLKDTILR